MLFEERAVVYWRSHSSLRTLLRQVHRYSTGDGITHLRVRMHTALSIKLILILGPFIVALAGQSLRWCFAGLIMNLLYIIYLGMQIRYRSVTLQTYLLKILVDIVRVASYAGGMYDRIRRRRGRS